MSSQRMSPLAWLGIALVAAIGLLAIFGTLVSTYGGGYGYEGMMGNGTWWWWAGLMMGIPAVILIVILVVVLGALREPAASPASGSGGNNPLELLKQRYARGELSREEYLRTRDDLTSAPNAS